MSYRNAFMEVVCGGIMALNIIRIYKLKLSSARRCLVCACFLYKLRQFGTKALPRTIHGTVLSAHVFCASCQSCLPRTVSSPVLLSKFMTMKAQGESL